MSSSFTIHIHDTYMIQLNSYRKKKENIDSSNDCICKQVIADGWQSVPLGLVRSPCLKVFSVLLCVKAHRNP